MGSADQRSRLFAASALISSFMMVPVAAAAQTVQEPVAQEAAVADAALAPTVGEIVVTARKRAESDISVPAVITAISGEKLAEKGVADVYGISQLTPQLEISNALGPIGGTIALRGVASGSTVGVDQAVAINIDGVAISNSGATRIGQFDLRQVEVLKGPQTLFFGKNSPGGVISFLSEDPTDFWDGYVRASHEFEAEEWRAEAAISGPIAEGLSFRVAGYVNSIGGYLRNPLQPNPAGGVAGPSETIAPNQDEIGGRLTLLYEPTADLTVNLKTAYTKVEGSSSYLLGQLIHCPLGTPQAPVGIFGAHPDNCRLDLEGWGIGDIPETVREQMPRFGDGKPHERNEQVIGSLNVSYDITPQLNLTSVTGLYLYDLTGQSPQVGPVVGIALSQDQFKRDYSQELRLSSRFDGPFDFMVGAYYQDSKFEEEPQLWFLAPFNAAKTFQEGRSVSAFGQLIWRFAENWELAGGGRYTEETKEVRIGRQLEGDVTHRMGRTEVSANDFSPELTLTYRPTSQLTLFAAYKEGFKSGGFNPSVTTSVPLNYDPSFGPESARGGEVGVKALLLDRSLRLNAAAYHYQYSDLQVSAYDPFRIAVVVANAASATVEGVEFDFQYEPLAIRGLSLTGALSYNKARYDEYIGACYVGQTISEGCDLVFASGRFTSTDFSGRQLPNAPDWAGNLNAAYEFPINGEMNFELNGGLRFKSSYNPAGDLAPGALQDGVTFVDLGARVFAEDGSWDLALIGRNVTDELRAYSITGATLSGTQSGLATGTHADLVGFINRPREIRLQLTVRSDFWRR